jgi:hypothetical protein
VPTPLFTSFTPTGRFDHEVLGTLVTPVAAATHTVPTDDGRPDGDLSRHGRDVIAET